MTGWNEPPTRGIEDPQQVLPLCRCAQCGGEIYPTDEFYTDTPEAPDSKDAVTLHTDCLMDWVRAQGDNNVAEQYGFERK